MHDWWALSEELSESERHEYYWRLWKLVLIETWITLKHSLLTSKLIHIISCNIHSKWYTWQDVTHIISSDVHSKWFISQDVIHIISNNSHQKWFTSSALMYTQNDLPYMTWFTLSAVIHIKSCLHHQHTHWKSCWLITVTLTYWSFKRSYDIF